MRALFLVWMLSAAFNEAAAQAPDPAPAPATASAPTPAPASAPRVAFPTLATPTARAPRTITAPTPAQRSQLPVRPDPATPPLDRTETLTVLAGSEITVAVSEALSSGRNKAGDEFQGTIAGAIRVNSVTVLDIGTEVRGRVEEIDTSGRVNGVANMRLILISIVHNGRTLPITTGSVSIEAESGKGRDAARVGGAAGLGVAIGALTGGTPRAGDAGVASGREVDFPAQSKLTFILSNDLTVRP